MEDKTPIYLLSIVGIVALVAVVYMLTGSSTSTTNTDKGLGSAISGNVVAEDTNVAPIDFRGLGRFLFGAVLIGVSVYMYTRQE